VGAAGVAVLASCDVGAGRGGGGRAAGAADVLVRAWRAGGAVPVRLSQAAGGDRCGFLTGRVTGVYVILQS